MPRIIKPLLTAAIALFPLVAVASPPSYAPLPGAAPVAHVVPAQGWWEQEHRQDAFRDRYWRLPPPERARYDQLEFQIRRSEDRLRHEAREGDRREYYQVAARIEQMRREQYRILHFWE